MNSASEKGYKKIPEMEILIEALEKEKANSKAKEDAYQDVLRKYAAVKKVAYLGRRREKYLKKSKSSEKNKVV